MTGQWSADNHRRALRTLLSGLKAGFAWVGFLVLVSCGGGSTGGGPPPPLPSSQTGSLNPANTNLANCFVSDTAVCSSTPLGSYHISALAAATISSANYLFWGDSGGNIYSAPVPTVTSTYPTPVLCYSSSSIGKVLSLAVASTASGPLFYSTTGGIYSLSLSSSQCTGTSTAGTLITGSSTASLAYNSSANLVIGVTSTGQYYSCTTTSTPSCTSQGTLPGLKETSQITAIGSDPTYSVVYIIAIGNTINRIYAYLVNSSGTLTYLMDYTGTELANPSGVALFQGTNASQSFCTTGPCTFLDVTNKTNTTITQYVLSYTISGTEPTNVAINQFNNSYFDCDLINPLAIAALPAPLTTGGSLNTPNVFIGENGQESAPCMGLTSGNYGNNITAYTIQGE